MADANAVPGYILMQKLADGASGEIYLADELATHLLVAIKILHPRNYHNRVETRRLVREGALGLRLCCHEHLAETFKVGRAGGIPYIVMELATGVCLRALLQAGRRLTEDETLRLAVALTHVLQYIHSRGVYHRDVKPDNVMLDGEVRYIKLLDFGFAETRWSARWGRLAGKPLEGTAAYLAPELVRGRRASFATDIYALGCTLYESLTGFAPFSGSSEQEVLEKVMNPNLRALPVVNTRPEVSFATEKIILTALEKDPAERYQSADQLWLELSRHPAIDAAETSI